MLQVFGTIQNNSALKRTETQTLAVCNCSRKQRASDGLVQSLGYCYLVSRSHMRSENGPPRNKIQIEVALRKFLKTNIEKGVLKFFW